MKKRIFLSVGALILLFIFFAIFWWVCDKQRPQFFKETKIIVGIFAVAIAGIWASFLFGLGGLFDLRGS